MRPLTHALAAALLLVLLPQAAPGQPAIAEQPVDWRLNRLDMIGGHATTMAGSPRLIDAPAGKAIEFDGQGDGLFVANNPLAGLQAFTVEIVFQPYAGGPKEQRFFHIQEDGTDNRLLFETRLTDDGRWFLDTFVKSGDNNTTLLAKESPHAIGPWYHAAVTVDGHTMKHYVSGIEELSAPVRFQPLGSGRASLGVRLNKVSWYKGAIRQVRITPRVLPPNEFLQP